jgi:hypothetical protein
MNVGSNKHEVINNFVEQRRIARSRAYIEHLTKGCGIQPTVPLKQFEVGRIVAIISNHTTAEGLKYQTVHIGQRLELGQETRLDPHIDICHLDDARKVFKMVKKWWKVELKHSLPPWWQRLARWILWLD